jgi:signal transduction histidine kinase
MIRKDNLILMEQMDAHMLFYYNVKTKNLELPYVQYENITGLKTKKIKMQGLTRSGTLWFVNDSMQIARSLYDIKTGALRITLISDSITANFYKYIAEIKDGYIINEDREGNLWMYDRTRGILLELDFIAGNMQKWDLKEGFYGSSGIEIKSLLEDKNGSIWLTSNYTLFMLDKKKGILKSLDKGDGLPEVSHSRFCALVDSKGFLYFGGMNGIYRFEPDRLYKNTAIPPIVITEFRIFNKEIGIDSSRKSVLTRNIAFTREINLKYNQNDLSFTFAALDYNNPAKNRYAYRMEGYQKNWIETGAADRTAAYTNLKPGKYVFRVKGTNNDGIWNEEGTFVNIIIHPPFWRTLLAYFVYGILFLMLLRGYIYWRTMRIRKEKLVLEKQVAERTTKIEEQKEELVAANTQLEKNQEDLHEINTLLEEQQEELMQQKEELQTTLENLQKTQEQLIESEKMAAIGGLVAGVAHEMNTPLGIGITAVSNLIEDVEKMAALYEKDEISRKDFKGFLESAHDTAKLIQKNLERAASLIQSFKQVSSDQVTEQQRIFALKEYINDILLSLRPKFREKKIEFNIVCDDELQMNSYPGVFAQIFTNLLLNSLQHGFYKRDTGVITIKADISNNQLKIQYSDNGTGISKKDLPHIFEPFYTSDQRRGTGLGLNIIYVLIKQKLRGTITCTSNLGEGVLFEIEVPQ